MDLKDFKAGVETLSRFTNQRQSEPDPFLMQIGKDGQLSLVSGNEHGLVAWRTGIQTSASPVKEGVSSKTLTQAAKALKGRSVSIGFEIGPKSLDIKASGGGSVRLPFEEPPALRPIKHEGEPVVFEFEKDDLDQFIAGVSAASADVHPNAIVMETATESTNLVRFASTDKYKMYTTYKYPVSGVLTEPVAVRAAIWNALRGATTNAEARIFESSVQLSLGPIQFSTGILDGHPVWPDIEGKFFPRGNVVDVVVQIERKALINAIKIVYPTVTDEASSIALMRTDKGDLMIQRIKGNAMTGTATLRGRGTGRIEVSGRYLLECLNAIADKVVYIHWNHVANNPIRIQGSTQQHASFVIAPVVRI